MATAAVQKKDALTGRSFIEFKDAFCIYPDTPLPDLNEEGAIAYEASDKSGNNNNLYALIYDPHTPPRLSILDGLTTLTEPHIFQVLDWGVIHWPQPSAKKIAILLEKDNAQFFVQELTEKFRPFTEDELVQGIIEPFFRILESFSLRGLTHRNIRTTNLRLTPKGRRHLILGSCLNFYPAFDQPALFETVESALTMPAARGEGTISDDLYALGVLISVLALGYHPFSNYADEHVIEEKMKSGSFGAIIGNSKVSVALLEPIKGLLIDDPFDRWTLLDLKSWVDGRRLNARQPVVPKRGSRPFAFEGTEYYYLDILLLSLMHNSHKGMSVFKNPAFHHWLKRSLSQENLSLELEAEYESLMKSGGGGTPEKLTSRLLMHINPKFPIFFKGMSFQIQGMGGALAYYREKPDKKQIIAEVIASRLPTHWIGSQHKSLPHITKMLDVFEKSPRIIGSSDLGQGIERVLYDLNQSYPCMSPLFRNMVVLNHNDVLRTLEEIAPQHMGAKDPFDKHILAFIASRGRAIGEALIASFRRDLANNNPGLAALRLYAQLQKQMQKQKFQLALPHLAKWILSNKTNSVINYKNIERQKTIEQKLAALTDHGNLQDLLEVADDLLLAHQDNHDYKEAQKYYFEVSSFIDMLEGEKKDIDKISVLIGSRIAAVMSTILAVMGSLIVLFNFL